tara:strand:+ start:430 stop:765 length:336 start_codon:yes stop_codon:yes gene_type:complete
MKSKIASKSIINKLTHEGVVSQDLLVLINNLTLEDLIAIKLELSCALVRNKLYGIDFWSNSCYIIREALLKFSISVSKSKKDAARFLGLDLREFNTQYKKYNIESYFKENE